MNKFDVVMGAIIAVGALMVLGLVAHWNETRIECIKANTHRPAAEVQVICGRP